MRRHRALTLLLVTGLTVVGTAISGSGFASSVAVGGPAPADFDGDGDTDVSIYRPGEGVWYVKDQPPFVQWGGQAGDIPVPGDYDADGNSDVATYRPAEGVWYVKDHPPFVQWGGQAGDIPVPGDYDADGESDHAIYRPSEGIWYVRDRSPFTQWGGQAGDVPVPGDYDGDGDTDIAIYRPSEGVWYVKDQSPFTQWGGQPGDIPVPGDYDADGDTDIAIYRPAEGVWYVKDQPPFVQWGASGDIPLVLAPAIRLAFFAPAAPTVTLTSTPSDPSSTTSATFAWDTTGVVESTDCSLRSGPPGGPIVSGPCTSPTTYTDLSPGTYRFLVLVSNAGGSAFAVFNWTILHVVPTVEITSGPEDGTLSDFAEFAYTIEGSPTTVTCLIDGSPHGDCGESSATVTGLTSGLHTFTVNAQNEAGTASDSYTWTIEHKLIPIGITQLKPRSAAAVFYDEADGSILAVNYLCEHDSIVGLPAGLTGWSTLVPGDPSGMCSSWASLQVAPATGVAIATSGRPACSESTSSACFEDEGFASVDELCRQGSGVYVECFFATGTGSQQTMQRGLQFIRGYPGGEVTTGPPALRSAWLEPVGCPSAYFNSSTATSCSALVQATIDLGAGRTAANAEVRYRVVRGQPGGLSTMCSFTTSTCDLQMTGPSWATSNQLPQFAPGTDGNAIALRVRLRNTTVNSTACGPNFGTQCQWFYTAAGISTTAPTDTQVHAAAIQRSFMGNAELSGSIDFVRLMADVDCDGALDQIESEAASQPAGSQRCFMIEVGTRGGAAQDQSDPPIALGVAGSAAFVLDCDPNLVSIEDEVANGCGIAYAPSSFESTPLCPGPPGFFDLPKPAPFDNWPPFTCVLSRTGSVLTQLIRGFNQRMFGDAINPSCPPDGSGFVSGRNYWSDANNMDDTWTFPNLKGDDPRIVRLAALPASAFTGVGNETYPIDTIIRFYITGWGSLSGGVLNVEDPCPGSAPPSSLGSSTSGFYFWGHVLP